MKAGFTLGSTGNKNALDCKISDLILRKLKSLNAKIHKDLFNDLPDFSEENIARYLNDSDFDYYGLIDLYSFDYAYQKDNSDDRNLTYSLVKEYLKNTRSCFYEIVALIYLQRHLQETNVEINSLNFADALIDKSLKYARKIASRANRLYKNKIRYWGMMISAKCQYFYINHLIRIKKPCCRAQ